jgi:hypothetical protein
MRTGNEIIALGENLPLPQHHKTHISLTLNPDRLEVKLRTAILYRSGKILQHL